MAIQVKHASLWIPDGNIVLCGKPSPNCDDMNNEYPADVVIQVLFCVHKSTLARQSQVFKDMLELPSEHFSTSDSFEGLPLVILEDSASDLDRLLNLLYDPWFVIQQFDTQHPLNDGVVK